MSLKQFSSALPSAYRPEQKIQYPGGPVVNLDDALRSTVCNSPEPEKPLTKIRLLGGAAGTVAPYIAPSAMVGVGANENAISKHSPRVHAIPNMRGLLAPPIIVPGRRFVEAMNALRHITMTREAAALNTTLLYMGVKLTYDGANTVTIEATNSSQTGVAMIPAKPREPMAPWAMVVPPEQIVRSLITLAPDADIEIAPSDRLHVAKFSFSPTGIPSEFAQRPPPPSDVAFQCIVKRRELAKVVESVKSFIPIDSLRVALRNIWLDPKRKMAAATDSKQVRCFKIDIRSKARLSHPTQFYLPFFMSLSATILEPNEFILLSVTSRKEIYIAGEEGQDYSLYSTPEGQLDMLDYQTSIPEPASEFVVPKEMLAEAARASLALYVEEDKRRGGMGLHFGDRALSIKAEAQGKLGSGDVHRELTYKRWSTAGTMLANELTIPASQLLDAIRGVEGDDLHLGFCKNHSKTDPVMVYGPDHGVMTVIAPIVNRKAQFGQEES